MSKKLILIRGPQGAGKSTLVRRAGLEGFNVSLDKIRNIVAGDVLAPNGQFTPSHDHAPLVWQIFNNSVDRRIAGGEVVCIDGTLANGSELYDLWKKFDQAGYGSLLIDLYGFDETLRLNRNAGRVERERVPELSVTRMKQMALAAPIPPIMRESKNLTAISVTNDAEGNDAIRAISGFLRDPRTQRDLSAYREVLHIGDIQGSHSPLADPRSPLRDGLDPEVFHIFLGDLFDRGKENGKVADWFVRHALGRPNVAFIAGNHEDYVDKQAAAGADDIDLPHSEWLRLSWPQIREAGLGWREMRAISRFSQDFLSYTWRGREVLCSHAGFVRWPSNMDLISQHQLRRGSGRYAVDVDMEWSRSEARTGRYQVHGHRNEKMRPTLASSLSFNLEGQVEFGGHLRLLRLDDTGFSNIDIRPTVFRTMQEDVAFNQEVERKSMSRFPPILPWAKPGIRPEPMSARTIESFRDHRMVQIKDMDNLPGIASVNFTRDAFYKAQWDEFTTLARGLFIDAEDNSIVARSYPKFFNHGERPETTGDALAAGVRFPVTAYEKLNGFLCITGYSERLGVPIIASKSRTHGPFADMAAEVLEETLGADALERMTRLSRDQLCSLVFEIEDPVRDPHIIKLENPRAVLLGCVRRAEAFEQASYQDLQKIAAWIGCEVKKVVARIPNERALASFNHRIEQDPNWTFEGRRVEGVVMEDDEGFAYKLKGHYYRNWKFMRSAVNEIRAAKETGRAPRLERFGQVEEPFLRFMDWAKTLSATALGLGIIALRDSFEGDRKTMEAIVDPAPAVEPVDKVAERFRGVIAQIAADERITAEGLERFITGALSDPKRADILREHEDYERLMQRAGLEAASGPEMF